MKTAAILGASGYTGRELVRLLAGHPTLRLAGAFSAREGDAPDAPELPFDAPVERLDWDRVAACDGVFLCTPHTLSAELAQRVLKLGPKVVDLSADFRLPDAQLYERTYEHAHPAPGLLAEAPYGLTELARDAVRGARLVANPGCYPTATLLALKPLVEAGLVDTRYTVVVDAKSGVSGAGKNASARTHFGATHENFLAYAVGGHRHAPEIQWHAGLKDLVFVPHLLPVFRGILATLYVKPAGGARAAQMRACLSETYARERFVKVYDRGQPELNRVQNTNACHIAVADNQDLVVLTSAIDNLLKGASGQALQNMNLVLGLDEAAGLS